MFKTIRIAVLVLVVAGVAGNSSNIHAATKAECGQLADVLAEFASAMRQQSRAVEDTDHDRLKIFMTEQAEIDGVNHMDSKRERFVDALHDYISSIENVESRMRQCSR